MVAEAAQGEAAEERVVPCVVTEASMQVLWQKQLLRVPILVKSVTVRSLFHLLKRLFVSEPARLVTMLLQ